MVYKKKDLNANQASTSHFGRMHRPLLTFLSPLNLLKVNSIALRDLEFIFHPKSGNTAAAS